MFTEHPLEFVVVAVHVAHVIGALTAAHAIMNVRTAQGAVAWSVALISTPFIAVPLYVVFGRNKFFGYVEALRAGGLDKQMDKGRFLRDVNSRKTDDSGTDVRINVFERLADMPMTKGNHIDLLIDGDATFDAIFKAIDDAKTYVLIEFFIVRADKLGTRLKDALLKKADAGVNVHFLYDEIGSQGLSKQYIQELNSHENVEIHRFKTTRGRANRFQINFRNHRKIVVVDGVVAFVGGHNVGDEYLGQGPEFSHWRDTHCRIRGPVVQETQLIFLDDWFWATRAIPELNWTPTFSDAATADALALPIGPADELENGSLYFIQAIQCAKRRLWITSPYFVPDPSVIDALQLAALRGVDVRVIIPEHKDHLMPFMAAYSYLPEVEATGIKIHRYLDGFLHQKVILIDDDLASVGTVNLDNRSMRLNFELTILVRDRDFAARVETMLNDDLTQCREFHVNEYAARGLLFKAAVKFFRLLAPIL